MPAFDPGGLFTARIYILNREYKQFFTQLLERTRNLPGVESAGLPAPFRFTDVNRDGPEPDRGSRKRGDAASEQGRHCRHPHRHAGLLRHAWRQHPQGPRLQRWRHQSTAARHRDQPTHGRTLLAARRCGRKANRRGDDKWLPIVGVVSDIRHQGLDKEPVDEAYASFGEAPQPAMSIVIRSAQPSPELPQQLAWIAHDIDPNAVVADVQPMTKIREDWLASPRTTAIFLGVFAVVAFASPRPASAE